MPPKMAEYAAECTSKNRQKIQKPIDFDQHCFLTSSQVLQLFIVDQKLNFFVRIFWRKNPNGSFQFRICFKNQFQDQKDCF